MNQALTKAGGPVLVPRQAANRSGPAHPPKLHRYDRLEYRFYSLVLFPLAVLAVLAKRMAPGSQSGAVAARKRNFFSEVIELNRTTVPWVFMGR